MSENKKSHPFGRAILSGLILASIGSICVGTVLYTQNITKPVIDSQIEHKMQSKIETLLPPNARGDNINYTCKIVSHKLIGNKMKLFIANSKNGIEGYILTYATSRGYSNPLVMIAGFDKDKNVYQADIQYSMETPGLGDKVMRKYGNFLDMLNGKNKENAKWDVKKFGGDFDFISGATVTSRAVVKATKDALDALDSIDLNKLKPCPKGDL